MSQRVIEVRGRGETTPAPPPVGGTTGVLTGARAVSDDPDALHAAVFPAPLTAVAAALIGGLLGAGAVYGVATRLADTLVGVVVIILVFALTLAGPRVHAAARSEVGRTVAVILESIGFGGVLGAVIVLI